MSELNNRRFPFVLICTLLLMGMARPAPGVVNGAEIPLTDHRFDGIGIVEYIAGGTCGGFISGTCILIAPNMVLVARHSIVESYQPLPAPGVITHRVRFRRGVNGAGFTNFEPVNCGYWLQEADIIQFVGAPNPSLDMVIGILVSPVQGIAPMPLELNAVPTAGSTIMLAGWGLSGTCSGEGNGWQLRQKTAILAHTAISSQFNFNDCSMSPCLSCPAGNWAVANLHDSGAPILMDCACSMTGDHEWRVVGIVLSSTSALRVTQWNQSGAIPAMQAAGMVCHLCQGDFDRDGIVSIHDVFLFIQSWFDGSAWAEADGVPGLAIPDIFAFLSDYFRGC